MGKTEFSFSVWRQSISSKKLWTCQVRIERLKATTKPTISSHFTKPVSIRCCFPLPLLFFGFSSFSHENNVDFNIEQVELNLTVRAFIYNTTEAYYRCTFTNGQCSLSILFPEGNSVVLTSPGPEQVNVLLSFKPKILLSMFSLRFILFWRLLQRHSLVIRII